MMLAMRGMGLVAVAALAVAAFADALGAQPQNAPQVPVRDQAPPPVASTASPETASQAPGSPLPSPSPSPTPFTGYVGNADVVVQAPLFGQKTTVGGRIAFEISARYVRADVLSISLPGADATLNAMMGTQLLPPGGYVALLDTETRIFTLWSPSRKRYYTSAPPKATPAPKNTPKPSPSPSASPGNPFSAFAGLAFVKNLDAFTVSLSLVGHGTTNGHPSTGFDFVLNRKDHNAEAFESHGRVQLADDFDEFPVQLAISAKGGGVPDSSARIDLTQLERRQPPPGDFVVPSGYERVDNAGDVFGGSPIPIPGATQR